jgi:hypothetical protein
MSEEALLSLVERYPHPVAIARRVGGSTFSTGLRRLEDRGLVSLRGGAYRVTGRGRDALQMNRILRLAVARAFAQSLVR